MTENRIVRQAQNSDLTAIAACAKAAYSIYTKRMGKPPAPMVADFASQIAENKVYVIEQSSQLAGFIVCFPLSGVNAWSVVRKQTVLKELAELKKQNTAKEQPIGKARTANEPKPSPARQVTSNAQKRTFNGVYFLENIAIDPKQQRAGLGKLLVNHVIAMATETECCSLELYTNETMVENIKWYQNLGFMEVERKYEDGFNRVYMRLNLTI